MITLNCFSAIYMPCHGQLADKRQSVIEDLQSLVDEICGRITFHLGTKMIPGYDDDPSVEFRLLDRVAGLRQSLALNL